MTKPLPLNMMKWNALLFTYCKGNNMSGSRSSTFNWYVPHGMQLSERYSGFLKTLKEIPNMSKATYRFDFSCQLAVTIYIRKFVMKFKCYCKYTFNSQNLPCGLFTLNCFKTQNNYDFFFSFLSFKTIFNYALNIHRGFVVYPLDFIVQVYSF